MKTLRSLLLTLFICGILFIPVSVASAFDGGSGVEGDPYLISTPEQLNKVRNGLGAHYKLVADIDLSGYTDWISIGTFSGTFDGNNHKIMNLEKMLFATVHLEGKISNLGLENVNVEFYTRVGTLAGTNGGIIENCYATGSVTGTRTNYDYYYGGLVGYNNGTIKNCYSTATVTSPGGNVGGLAGYNGKTIENCFAIGDVTGYGSSQMAGTGGLVGHNNTSATIKSCYSTGNVEGDYYIGGLVGRNYATIQDCYSTGNVIGKSVAGGIVGSYNSGTIINCYYVGDVTATFAKPIYGTMFSDAKEPINCYWESEVYGTYHNSIQGQEEAKHTAQMKQLDTFKNWDFLNTWQIDEGSSYPYFRNMGKPTFLEHPASGIEGLGIEGDPYLISTPEQLNKVRNGLGAHYKLVADIDLSGYTDWISIGTFSGTFDGNNHKIMNLEKMLFATVHLEGKISNLGLENVNVEFYTRVGTLAGTNGGIIENCYATGSVTGTRTNYDYYYGGLVGYNNGTIKNCYSTATVTSPGGNVGGLAGYNGKTIENCFAIGDVTGYGSSQMAGTGGLVGHNNTSATIKSCYSTGNVSANYRFGGLIGYNGGTASSSYWDKDTSGQTTSNGGEGKTHEEMKQQVTFVNWDFTEIWDIVDDTTYPWLRMLPKPDMPDFKYIPVTGVTLDPTEITLNLEETKTAALTATVSPEDASDKRVTWSSSDEAIATVDSTGNVTAISAGIATITVTTEDGGFQATCEVTVEGGFNPAVTAKTDKLYYSEVAGYNIIIITGEVTGLTAGDNITIKAELIKKGEETKTTKAEAGTADAEGKVSFEHQFTVDSSVVEGTYNIEVTVTKP